MNQKQRDVDRDRRLRKKYGITLVEYNQLRTKQNNACAGCGFIPSHNQRRLSVDHDHATGKVRGLLCWHCNALVGRAKDNPDILDNLAKYLRKGVA